MAGFIVYLHIFPNGKKYVGISSQTPNRRWRNGKGYEGQPVYNAILKYGWQNIKHEILFTNLTKEQAEQKEIELIKALNTNSHKNGYNVENGGYYFNDVTRRKIRKSGQNKFKNGCKLSEEQFKILMEAHVKAKSKPVICIETNIIYMNSEEAQRLTGIQACNINRCCNKKTYRKTAGGFHWEYTKKGGE